MNHFQKPFPEINSPGINSIEIKRQLIHNNLSPIAYSRF